MQVVNISDIKAREVGGNYFKGKVSIQSIIGKNENEFRVSVINFSPGAESVFHAHTADHVLYVTGGEGIVATESDEIRVPTGGIVHIPAGERHKHGATKDTAVSLIAIMPPGGTSF